MAVNTKTIKRRIKTVQSTKKITKAMELVAAAKMRKAVEAAEQARTYAVLAWELLQELSKLHKKIDLPLFALRPVQRLLVILVTSNRGLCGSFNTNIIRKTIDLMHHKEDVVISVIAIGKKGGEMAAKAGYPLEATFTESFDTPTLRDILPISRIAIRGYEEKKYDKVVVAYTDFRSALRQIATLKQVLPISPHELEEMARNLPREGAVLPTMEKDDRLFEPNRATVLNQMVPRLVETQLYQAVLESAASEHASRMMAMRNASDAAEDMVQELSLNFNKARQASITQQIAEIAGGAAALG